MHDAPDSGGDTVRQRYCCRPSPIFFGVQRLPTQASGIRLNSKTQNFYISSRSHARPYRCGLLLRPFGEMLHKHEKYRRLNQCLVLLEQIAPAKRAVWLYLILPVLYQHGRQIFYLIHTLRPSHAQSIRERGSTCYFPRDFSCISYSHKTPYAHHRPSESTRTSSVRSITCMQQERLADGHRHILIMTAGTRSPRRQPAPLRQDHDHLRLVTHWH